MFVKGSNVSQVSDITNLIKKLIAWIDLKSWFEKLIWKLEGWFGRLGKSNDWWLNQSWDVGRVII